MIDMQTELTISLGGFPPLCARGCEQELTPIDQGEFKRTVNGELIYLNSEIKTKYKSVISCNDKNAIATDGIHRGSEIVIGCIQRLWQKVENTTSIVLDKEPVADSIIAFNEMHEQVSIRYVNGKNIELDNFIGCAFVSYRPLLTMKVTNYSLSTNEWGIKVGWKIECEEI